jgi:hypothetical protein
MRTFRCARLILGKIAGVKFDAAAAMLTMASGGARRCQVGSFGHIFTFKQSSSRAIQTPIAPIVHPKMNTGKEFPSAFI